MTSLPRDWIGGPTLTGDRVVLTPVTPADAEALAATIDDPAAFAWTPVPIGVEATRQFINLALDTPNRLAFTVTDRRSDAIVGTTSYYEISPTYRSLAIGFTWYTSSAQGAGVNPDAKYLLLRHAFETLGAVRVVWHTDERNAQSRAAILKLGTTFEGLLRKHRPAVDGGWRTTAQYSMVDDEWPDCRDRLRARITP
ncbi:GNAT family N-acetyltransferase [Jongsikchunia kroppenstedtii]|uniref:GNAT family N-acetyltransferase n=1 Tax=Jongsikchunia kroppenstedtii TaxID=1121721 RepID=UPI00037780EE|nr:GNAT family protein [Jongsikchunia kroppenstedtii]